MKLIWIVYGQTGEYDDSREWTVCAYEEESLARIHAAQATVFAQKLMSLYRGNRWDIPKGANPYDTHMQVDTNGILYSCYGTQIRDALPT